jgi:hypothetical protein
LSRLEVAMTIILNYAVAIQLCRVIMRLVLA